MRSGNRTSGINIIGNLPSWGTHFCQFYGTKEDLIDILVPYFKAGLEDNEYCVWSISEPLDEKEVKEALKVFIPDIDAYLENGQIEIIPYTYWHVEEDTFDPQTILNDLVEKTSKALANGYDGLRYSGNDFFDQEKLLDSVIGKYPIMALCTYPIDKCSSIDIIEIAANHQLTLGKRKGKWELIEGSGKNINNCEQTEKALQESKERYKAIFDNSLDGIFLTVPDGTILAANPAACQMFGMTEEEIIRVGRDGTVDTSDPRLKYILGERVRTGRFKGELNHRRKDGTVFPSEISGTLFKDKNGLTKGVMIIRDITERKQVEEAFRRSEELLRFALETSHTGAWDFNLVDHTTYRSLEHDRIFGYKQLLPQWTYEMLLDHVLPEDREMVEAKFREATGEYKDWDFECRIRRIDGEIRWIRTAGRHRVDATGNIRIAGIVQDITESKQAEKVLRENELRNKVTEAIEVERRRLFDVLETLPIMITLLTPDHQIAFANRCFREKFGELCIRQCYEYCFGRTKSCELCEVYKVLEADQPHRWEVNMPDGSIFDTYDLPFTDVDGSPMILEMDIDITERKAAEEKLRDSEEKYRNIVETSNELIIILDNEAVITYVNKRMLDMLGYTMEESIGKSIWDFISEESKPIVKMNLEKRRQGISENYELKLVRKDGSPLWTLISTKPLFDKEGKYVGAMGMLTDITERKKAEETLTNIETSRKKEIHHRIKNNLQVISSLLDLQAEQFKNQEDIRDSEVLEAFRESQDRVISMALIHEELYRGEELDKLNFSPYIEELANTLFQTYRLGNTDISLNIDLEENLFFDMDTAVPLGIIVNELVSNSLKHAFPDRNKGEIRIKLHREYSIEFESKDYESTNNRFTLSISDNGVGIPEDLDIEGLDSLGMQLVTSLVDQLDGELELKRNNGTEFTMRFIITKK
ncbi:PAS domain S-box protein [Methanosarcina sp. UBA289]|uniref:PAS domain S-box protein n=1 Tax=Methanosarcina sp. UBA289 TaxID=1915574 RepID=UPI0025E831F6|nr:PAS domain S-box protein [Methanosarcina sp. UBA289]